MGDSQWLDLNVTRKCLQQELEDSNSKIETLELRSRAS